MEFAVAAIAKALKEHPEKLLLLACLIMILVLYKAGINQWLSCAAPLSLYIVFQVGAAVNSHFHVRSGETEVKRLESEARLIAEQRQAKRKKK